MRLKYDRFLLVCVALAYDGNRLEFIEMGNIVVDKAARIRYKFIMGKLSELTIETIWGSKYCINY